MAPETPSKRLRQRLRTLRDRLKTREPSQLFSWSAIMLGAAIALASLWPVAASVWALLGLSGIQTLQTVGVVVGGALLTIGIVWRNRGRATPVGLFWLILAGWLLACAAVGTLSAGAWWLLDTPTWEPPTTLTPQDLDAIATRAFAIIAGLGGVALLVISYRRQRATENGEQREQTRLFTERFDIASEKLGSNQPAVRLAGVHALAHLADDAPADRDDLVQMVIDVLCAYLRMPYEPEPEGLPEGATDEQSTDWQSRWQTFTAFREVRHSVIRIVANRLQRNTRWQGKTYDFTGVVFDGGDFSGASFTGGQTIFSSAEFVGGLTRFDATKFIGGRVSFEGANFSGGAVNFAFTEFSGSNVDFTNADFTKSSIKFMGAQFKGGYLDFTLSRFNGGKVDFSRTEYCGATMVFAYARFTEGVVDFSAVKFVGGVVDFTNIPAFKVILGQGNSREATGVCPVGLRESVAAGTPGVVDLPEAWRNEGSDASSDHTADEVASSEEGV
ncbi:pentapeptide repeat-containing protein [Streptomonospora algeriensis]|uniref:Pentapeptide repeat-containing protein n=1 Tax=Streptomonospora algeriensis TaxID=995084 RepID=A0ABW3BFX8_9ACTN